jgi:hypothetical protein
MRLPVVLVSLCALAVAALAAPDPRMIVRLGARSYEELIENVRIDGTTRDIAGARPGETYDLVCDRSDLPALQASGLKLEVLVTDLESLARVRATDGYYQTYDSLLRVMRNLAASYPSICRLESIGPTYQGRWVHGLKISDNPGVDENEPEMLYFGCIHAREWATPQICRHLADTLIRNYSSNSAFQNYINSHEVWVFPCLNVDGYVYDYPTGYSWRKNRQPFGGSTGCDLNRDFNGACDGNRFADWGSLVPNSNTSHNPSDLTFFGGRGAWGVATNAIQEFFKTRTFVGVISFHSYSELVLWPNGIGTKVLDSTYIANLGTQVASRIGRLSGGTYTPQQSNYLYPTNCGSDDWMWGWGHYVGGFPCMSYTVEVGTQFYQPVSDLDSIITSSFRGAWYHMQQADAITSALEGAVPRPILAPLDSVSPDFTLHWTPTRPDQNHPDYWEVEELTGLSVATEDFETSTARWTLQGAARSTTQRHAGTYSIYLGTGNNIANYAMTADPYPVQPGDSLIFWVWYSTQSNRDVAVAEVALEGREWVQLHDRYTGNSGGWLRRAYPLEPWAGKSVFIRFRYMTDGTTTGSGVYVDDVWPVPSFTGRTVLSSSVPDSFYNITGKAVGHYYYRARGHNVAWGWNDKGPLEDVYVVDLAADAACTAILAPTGTVDSGPAITPRARVRNLGAATATFPVLMRIGAGYTDTRTVSGLAPGDSSDVSFNPWTPTRGTFAMACSTRLTGDDNSANDRQTGSVTVRVRDVAPARIVAPSGTIDSTGSLIPACSLYNYGTTTETYPVRLRIGAGYVQAATVTAHAPGSRVLVQFPAWTAVGRGAHAVACSTELNGDLVAGNNRLSGSVTVNVTDVGATAIAAPAGTVPVGTVVTPLCSLRNYGTTVCSYDVRLTVGSVYDQTASVTAHAPGITVALSFPDWNASTSGSYAVACSTRLGNDAVSANDRRAGSVVVAALDVGVDAVVAPTGTVSPGTPVTPHARLRNFATTDAVFDAWVEVRNSVGVAVHVDSLSALGLAAGASVEVDFAPWGADPAGRYSIVAWTVMNLDENPANDTLAAEFVVGTTLPAGWSELAPVPLMPSGRAVKDGGWLAWDASQGKVFAAKGYKTGDFYCYEPVSGAWTELAPWPLGNEAKPPYKGSAGTSDGAGRVYATKGNNNTGFWRYDAQANAWEQLADVPLGLSNKKVKGGTDLVYVDEGDSQYVYLLKGYKTEFYRYNTYSGAWYVLADAPAGALPKWDKGSWLAYDGVGQIYAHKAKNHELYAYDLGTQTWGPALTGMPLVNNQTGKSKKSKDGGCGIFSPGGWGIWALKGGNTQDYYWLDLGTTAWVEKETIPAFGYTAKKKRVKAGADIVTDGEVLYALKGNKTLEFWRYVPGTLDAGRSTQNARTGVQGVEREAPGVRLVVQTPSRGGATVRWSGLPTAARTILVFDAAGRLARRIAPAGSAGSLQLRGLAAGVYVAEVCAGDGVTRTRFVVAR